MASLATLHHVTHVSSSHHTTLHSADHSMTSHHIGGSAHQTNPTSHVIPLIRPNSNVHTIAPGEPHPTVQHHSLGVDHKGGDLNVHVNDKGYSIGGQDCFGGTHDTICIGGNYGNTWGGHANGGGMATITWSHQW